MGGDIENPSYSDLGTDETGYIEVVSIEYNSDIITYEELLSVFFDCHDPTSWDCQKGDVGNLYRSVIFYHEDKDCETALQIIDKLNSSKKYNKPVVTQVRKASSFVKAKESDQHYYKKHSN